MKANISYFMLVSVTLMKDEKLSRFKPDWITTKHFSKTACDEDYINDDEVMFQHKYVSKPMTKQELIPILSEFESTCNTMGSLTSEFGWQPAIAFDCDRINAYVTPLLDSEAVMPFLKSLPKEQFEIKRDRINQFIDEHLNWLKEFFDTDEEDSPETTKYIDIETLELIF